MKRFHVHVAVDDLEAGVRFYSALFAHQPSVLKDDYAKWSLEDPRVNFAISQRGRAPRLDHLGIQVESDAELQEMRDRLAQAQLPSVEQAGAVCCYARSDKHWTVDPAGVPWESFHSLEDAAVYGPDTRVAGAACCAPTAADIRESSASRAGGAGSCGSADTRCC